MTKTDLARQALELPIDEQLDLAQTLWDKAAPAPDLTLPLELRELLEARRLEARTNPGAGLSWQEVKARLLGRA